MSEYGIVLYDLAEGQFCAECGRHFTMRLYGAHGGCKTCIELVTRHHCQSARPFPPIGGCEPGVLRECADCGTVWAVAEEAEECGECGAATGTVKRWVVSVPGDRVDAAPRSEIPPIYTPFRKPRFAGAASGETK